jgi:hypothetical protein
VNLYYKIVYRGLEGRICKWEEEGARGEGGEGTVTEAGRREARD